MSKGMSPSFNVTDGVEPPWKISKKGSVYCLWNELADEIKSELKEEHGAQATVAQFHYYVLQADNGNFLVFRNFREGSKNDEKHGYNSELREDLSEIMAVPIEEANDLLQSGAKYIVVGNDPVKVVDGKFFVVLGKK